MHFQRWQKVLRMRLFCMVIPYYLEGKHNGFGGFYGQKDKEKGEYGKCSDR